MVFDDLLGTPGTLFSRIPDRVFRLLFVPVVPVEIHRKIRSSINYQAFHVVLRASGQPLLEYVCVGSMDPK